MKNKWFHFRNFQPRMSLYIEGEAAPVPAGGGSDPAPPADPVPPAAAAPAPGADPQPEPTELEALLAGEIVDDPAPVVDPNDPFAAVKDNPQFMEMSQAAESFKAVMAAAGAPNVENLQAQIGDAHTLYGVVQGKIPAGQLLDNLSVYGPEVQKRVAEECLSWLQSKGLVQGATPEDPALAAVRQMEEKLAAREQADQQAALNKRVEGAKSLVHGEIGKFLESKGLKGFEAKFLSMIGPQFAGKEMSLVEAAEKGDFKTVQKALQSAYNNEVKYMSAWFKALKERKQAKADKIPNIAGGTGKGAVTPIKDRPASDDPKFIDWMIQQGNAAAGQ